MSSLLGYRGLGSLNPLEVVQLNSTDLELDNCGSPIARRTDQFLEFPKTYLYTLSWALDANIQYFLDERRPIASTADFILDRVSGPSANGVSLRFIWPNGRFSANRRIPSTFYFFTGDYMLGLGDGVMVPAGEWLGIELEIAANTGAGSYTIGFEGRLRYYLKPQTRGHRGMGR